MKNRDPNSETILKKITAFAGRNRAGGKRPAAASGTPRAAPRPGTRPGRPHRRRTSRPLRRCAHPARANAPAPRSARRGHPGQGQADDVQPGPGPEALAQPAAADSADGQADRDVEPEDPLPVDALTTAPPTIGPAATARPVIPPHSPMAAPRFSAGKASLIRVSVSGMTHGRPGALHDPGAR